MCFKKPGQPTKTKRAIYYLATIVLGVLLSLLVHSLIEIKYLAWAESQGVVITFYNACALAPWLQIALWILGAIGGLFLGRWWWRWVYVERRWEKKTK